VGSQNKVGRCSADGDARRSPPILPRHAPSAGRSARVGPKDPEPWWWISRPAGPSARPIMSAHGIINPTPDCVRRAPPARRPRRPPPPPAVPAPPHPIRRPTRCAPRDSAAAIRNQTCHPATSKLLGKIYRDPSIRRPGRRITKLVQVSS